MKRIPDVIGEKVFVAELILQNQGFIIQTRLTTPPWEGKTLGDLIVVRQRLKKENIVELIICAEDHQR